MKWMVSINDLDAVQRRAVELRYLFLVPRHITHTYDHALKRPSASCLEPSSFQVDLSRWPMTTATKTLLLHLAHRLNYAIRID